MIEKILKFIQGNTVNTQSNVVFNSRDAIPEITEYLQDILSDLRTFEYHLKDTFDGNALSEALNDRLPQSFSGDGRQKFIEDVVSLCELFFNRTKSKTIRFQIEIVTTNMCRLFHKDNLRERLICTYVGPGTEWLDHDNVNRNGLGKGNNNKIVKDFEKVNRGKLFEVLILKGSKHEDGPSDIHRSPPIENDDQNNSVTRVLLKIDESDREESCEYECC